MIIVQPVMRKEAERVTTRCCLDDINCHPINEPQFSCYPAMPNGNEEYYPEDKVVFR